MAMLIRTHDWASTPLGPIGRWPQSLKTIVDLMLASRSMMSLVWGPEAIHLYNDSFTDLLREHRTLALGRSAYETFARSRDVFEADIAAGMAGRSVRLPAQRYPVLRQGHLEDAWFDVEYAPVRDDLGAVGGVLWTLKETTAQHQAEQALRASEARHRLLIESWTQAVWETDAEGVVVTDSPSWRAYTGQTLEEWLGFGWLNAIHPDDRAYAERQWREAVAARGRVDAEFRLRAPDGGWRWTNVRAAPVLDAEGKIEKWAGMNIDIHARKRAEAALRQSEERQAFQSRQNEARLRGVLDGMTEGFGLLSQDFTILEHNAEALRLDGRARDQIVGRSHWDVYPGSEDSELGRLLKRAMAERVPVSLEHNYAWEKGRALWLDMRAYPTPDGALAVFWRDVTDRREAEIALQESEQKYRALFDSMDEAYAVVEVLKDAAGSWVDFRFIEVNPAFLEHTSMPWPVGQTATELLGEPNPRWAELYGQALDTGAPIRVEEREPTLDRVFDLNIFSLDRERNRVAVLFTNITERKRAEAALRESEALRRVALDSVGMGAWIWDTRADTVRADEVVQRLWGVSTDEQPHAVSLYADLMYSEGAAWLAAVVAKEITPGEEFYTQVQVASGSASSRWVELRGRAMRDKPWIVNGVSFDVTEQKASAQRQQVLINELQHRARNLLGVVSAVASRTLGQGGSVDGFEERLQALSRAQGLLSKGGSDTVEVGSLVRAELAAHTPEGSDRVHVGGPAVRLTALRVQNFALALHELTTNAVKYGALKNSAGRLDVTWEVVQDGRARRRLALIWSESGVAVPPEAGTRRGYGTELIQEALAYALEAEVDYILGRDGVRCRIEMPIS